MQEQKSEGASENTGGIRDIVAKGVRYAALRFPESEELQRLLETAKITPNSDIAGAADVVPPSQPGDTVQVRFNPELVAELRRDHRYPEWVICATIERLVLALGSRWNLSEPEATKLAAHRERRRRAPSSGAGPFENP